eukprot:2015935-Amphidinium_carterae.1
MHAGAAGILKEITITHDYAAPCCRHEHGPCARICQALVQHEQMSIAPALLPDAKHTTSKRE